jgi:hypothetical protein
MFAFLEWLCVRLLPITERSMAAEFGPPPAVRYPELAAYSDAELYRRGRDEILAEIKARRAGKAVGRDVQRVA